MGWMQKWIMILDNRTEMYLGNSCSIEDFNMFLTGYIAARSDLEMEAFDADENELLEKFTEWLKIRVNMPETKLGWLQLINIYANSDAETFKCFAKLWKEFLEDQGVSQ